MMLGNATIDALNRIAARAQDVLSAYAPGAVPLANDVARSENAPRYAADPLSVAAPPNAYFVVDDTHRGRAFTRDGAFVLERGVLTTKDGAAVLGFAGGDARGAIPAPLRLAPTDVALARFSDVRVESDGTVSYARIAIDPRTAEKTVERVAVGKVALARFPAGTVPTRLDAQHVSAPAGMVPHLGTPADGAFAGLATYARDGGAVDLDAGLQKLSEAYIAFSALHAAQKARGGTDKVAMDLVK